MRRWIFCIHKYTALATGVFLLVIGLSGSVLAFDEEIAGVLYRDLQRIAGAASKVSLADQATIVRSTFPGESFYGVRLGSDERAAAFLTGGKQVFVNGHTGEVLGVRTRDSLLSVIHRLHANLIAPGGRTVVAVCAFVLVMLSVTGLVLWWREKSSPRLRTVSWRTHNVVGVWSNLYLLLLGLSTICMVLPVNPLIFRVTGSKPPDRPARRSVVQAGTTPISPDRAAEVAAAALPGLSVETVIFPFGSSGIYRVGMRTGESTLLAGDVQIDQYSGAVLAADRPDYSDSAMRIIQGNRSFHTGQWLGIPSKILAALAGLAIAAQAFTGFLMWQRGHSRSG
jgi:uncharacterized iron-regulated membrane protein